MNEKKNYNGQAYNGTKKLDKKFLKKCFVFLKSISV